MPRQAAEVNTDCHGVPWRNVHERVLLEASARALGDDEKVLAHKATLLDEAKHARWKPSLDGPSFAAGRIKEARAELRIPEGLALLGGRAFAGGPPDHSLPRPNLFLSVSGLRNEGAGVLKSKAALQPRQAVLEVVNEELSELKQLQAVQVALARQLLPDTEEDGPLARMTGLFMDTIRATKDAHARINLRAVEDVIERSRSELQSSAVWRDSLSPGALYSPSPRRPRRPGRPRDRRSSPRRRWSSPAPRDRRRGRSSSSSDRSPSPSSPRVFPERPRSTPRGRRGGKGSRAKKSKKEGPRSLGKGGKSNRDSERPKGGGRPGKTKQGKKPRGKKGQ